MKRSKNNYRSVLFIIKILVVAKRLFKEKITAHFEKIKEKKEAAVKQRRREEGELSEEELKLEDEISEDEYDEDGNLIEKNPDDYYYEDE